MSRTRRHHKEEPRHPSRSKQVACPTPSGRHSCLRPREAEASTKRWITAVPQGAGRSFLRLAYVRVLKDGRCRTPESTAPEASISANLRSRFRKSFQDRPLG